MESRSSWNIISSLHIYFVRLQHYKIAGAVPEKSSVSFKECESKPKGKYELKRAVLNRPLSLAENAGLVLNNHIGDLDTHWYLLIFI